MLLAVSATAQPAAAIQRDQSTVVPIITGMFPATRGTDGVTSVTVHNVGFFTSALHVLFGGTPTASIVRRSSIWQVAVTPPAILRARQMCLCHCAAWSSHVASTFNS